MKFNLTVLFSILMITTFGQRQNPFFLQKRLYKSPDPKISYHFQNDTILINKNNSITSYNYLAKPATITISSNGNKIMALPQDNMPCIIPDMKQSNMPVISPPARGNMPNASTHHPPPPFQYLEIKPKLR